MGIQLTTNFDANFNKPEFSNRVKDDIAGRDAIVYRYEGLKVYVKDDGAGNPTNYQLQGGITNSHWVNIGIPVSSSFVLNKNGVVEAGATVEIPAGGMMEKIVFNNLISGRTAYLDIGTTPNGHEITSDYQIDFGWNYLVFVSIYEATQWIYLSGNFDSATINVYVTYQKLI